MSTSEDFAHAMERRDWRDAEQHLNNMDANELVRVADAFNQAGQYELSRELHEHARLRKLGENGVRIRIPLR